MIDVPELVHRDKGNEHAVQSRIDLFMVHCRRRRHEQLSAHQLVRVAVVRKTVELLERPHLRVCRHGNGPG